ncbi:MAG: carbon-nitrogen hydrolase family protein [Euryarchaeota archaeon]|nr:carbon-nitrogen hydrolase family protein [Euryarchaeota archaeon]
MGVKIALCQMKSTDDDVGANLDSIKRSMTHADADLYVFPELFLSGPDADHAAAKEDVEFAVDRMSVWCSEKDVALVFGAPSYVGGTVRDSVYFVTQNGAVRYDGLHLPEENRAFTRGKGPAVADFKGMRFGLLLGHDLFFPELTRFYAENGVRVNICLAASAGRDLELQDRLLNARSLECLAYTVFANGLGAHGAGRSRLIGPLGDTLFEADGRESIDCVYVDDEVVSKARGVRRHLAERRRDILWRI